MNLIVLGVITVLLALTVSSSEPAVPLRSLCVLDAEKACWVDKEAGEKREPQAGDYVLSPEDMNRILEKLKSVQ